MPKNTVNPLPQRHTAESAQREMEEALEQQVELQLQLEDKELELTALKRAFNKAGARARQALQLLAAARAGTVPHIANRSTTISVSPESDDQEWETRIADAKRSLRLESSRSCNRAPRTNCRQPDQDDCSTRAVTTLRQTSEIDFQNNFDQLAQDEGAKLDLSMLKKGALQELTKCRQGIGLTAKQIEKLKDAVNGSTIAALERFQRETENWDQAIKGFGPEGITQLQDAQLELRTLFPMPTAQDTSTPQARSQSSYDESEIDSTEPIDPIDIDEAEEWLDELIYRCDEIEQEITNLEGIRFLRRVKQEAEDMLDQLQLGDAVTSEQTRIIQEWQRDVEAWSSGVNENEEEDDAEDEEESDEADEDYDEEFDDEDYDNEADFDDDLDFFDGSTDV